MHPVTGESVVCHPKDSDPLAALIFKVSMMEGRKLCFVRVYSGRLKAGADLYNPTLKRKEKVARIPAGTAYRQSAKIVNVAKLGGIKIGGTDLWIGDYTVEPENGGVGVFAHEFGHDLGLPDLYDTSGNVGGAENSTGFWTLYSSGSYGSSGKPEDGIGSKPIPMSAYEKIYLGWSNYDVVAPGERKSVKLGPSNYNTKQAQQLVMLLPDKNVTNVIGTPFAMVGVPFVPVNYRLADDQLVLADINRLVLAQMQKSPRPHDRNGVSTLVSLVELGDELRTLPR